MSAIVDKYAVLSDHADDGTCSENAGRQVNARAYPPLCAGICCSVRASQDAQIGSIWVSERQAPLALALRGAGRLHRRQRPGAASPSGSPLGDALTAVAAFAYRSPGTASPGQTCSPSSAGFTWLMARRPCQANHLPPGRAPSSPQPLPRRLRDHERAVRDARRATEKRDAATMSTNRLPCARNPRFYMHVLNAVFMHFWMMGIAAD